MGVNFVIGCRRCKQRVWMLRGTESKPLHKFWREHWDHREDVVLSCDQSNLGDHLMDYKDVGEDWHD